MFNTEKEIFEFFDNLNKDKTHYNSSNDICTPMGCVKEMIDEIPEEFWNRENIKILDCCAGNGNFPAYICQKTSLSNIYFRIMIIDLSLTFPLSNHDYLKFQLQFLILLILILNLPLK